MILRGQVVKLHNIADDLKYTEFVLYRPQCGSSKEVAVCLPKDFFSLLTHWKFILGYANVIDKIM